MTYEEIKNILDKAFVASDRAARLRLTELQAAGPKYAVTQNGNVQGVMLDLCGFAYCMIPTQNGFSRRSKALKRLLEEGILTWSDYSKAFFVKKSYIDQAYSVNVAAAQAACEIIKASGLECYTDSRLD